MRKSFFALIFLPLFLTGCSSKFAYNNLDWLLYWYLDDYVELDKAQKARFDEKLEKWLKWHREEELARYKADLVDLKNRINQGPLTEEELLQALGLGRKHWEHLRDKLAPELSEMAAFLHDEQVKELFEKLEKDNLDEEEEWNEEKDEERIENRAKRIQKQIKNSIGKLTKQQIEIVEQYAPQFTSNFENWLSYRRTIQAEAKTLFDSRKEDSEFSKKLLVIMTQPELYQSEEYKAASLANRQLSARMIAEINQTLTKKQTRRLNRELDNLIEDIDDLIND